MTPVHDQQPAADRAAINRANAQHSTCPRTEEGKQRSAQNATRHGLNSNHNVVKTGEEAEFASVAESLRADVMPHGPLEETAFQKLLTARWNMIRVQKLEKDCSSRVKARTRSATPTPNKTRCCTSATISATKAATTGL